MIATIIRDWAFERKAERWVQIDRCLARKDTRLSHVYPDEINDLYEPMSCSVCEQGTFEDDVEQLHEERVELWCKRLTSLDSRLEIAKCVQIIAQDFGIRPYFMINKSCHRHRKTDIDAKAYMILPLARVLVSYTWGDGVISFAVESHVDHSLLADLTEHQRRMFNAAATALSLQPYDADEDESWCTINSVKDIRPSRCDCK
ncbi:MAG: hypothetical protein Q9210_005129 [Variospora velana]